MVSQFPFVSEPILPTSPLDIAAFIRRIARRPTIGGRKREPRPSFVSPFSRAFDIDVTRPTLMSQAGLGARSFVPGAGLGTASVMAASTAPLAADIGRSLSRVVGTRGPEPRLPAGLFTNGLGGQGEFEQALTGLPPLLPFTAQTRQQAREEAETFRADEAASALEANVLAGISGLVTDPSFAKKLERDELSEYDIQMLERRGEALIAQLELHRQSLLRSPLGRLELSENRAAKLRTAEAAIASARAQMQNAASSLRAGMERGSFVSQVGLEPFREKARRGEMTTRDWNEIDRRFEVMIGRKDITPTQGQRILRAKEELLQEFRELQSGVERGRDVERRTRETEIASRNFRRDSAARAELGELGQVDVANFQAQIETLNQLIRTVPPEQQGQVAANIQGLQQELASLQSRSGEVRRQREPLSDPGAQAFVRSIGRQLFPNVAPEVLAGVPIELLLAFLGGGVGGVSEPTSAPRVPVTRFR